jgi:hypothetical protein
MKFPITRKDLQAFDYVKEKEEEKEEENQKIFKQILDGLCKEFQQNMLLNSREKRFVWKKRGIDSIRYLGCMSNREGMEDKDKYLPMFIEKLKELFIGCDIIIDPLKTYLIIDWS